MARHSGPVIDAHHHLWRARPGAHPWIDGTAALARDFTARDHAAAFGGAGIVATVWVEALARDPEAELMRAETERSDSGGRVATALVAHAPLDAPDIAVRLDRLMALSPAMRGVRDIVSAGGGRPGPARRPDLLDCPRFRDGLAALSVRGLSFDLMLRPHQMTQAARLLDALPGLAVAVEHAGDPWDQSPAGLARWADGLRALATRPETILKVSALQCHDPGWSVESLRRLFEPMVDTFGPARMAWGSDWPVHDLACPGPDALAACRDLTADWPAEAQQHLFHATAARFYRIALPPDAAYQDPLSPRG